MQESCTRLLIFQLSSNASVDITGNTGQALPFCYNFNQSINNVTLSSGLQNLIFSREWTMWLGPAASRSSPLAEISSRECTMWLFLAASLTPRRIRTTTCSDQNLRRHCACCLKNFIQNRSRWVFKTSPQNPNHEFSLALERVSAKSLWKKNRITTGPVVNSWFSAGNLEREKYHEIIIESSMLTGVFNLHHPPQAVPSNARRSFCTIVHRRCAKHYGVLWGSGLLIALKRPGWCECDKVCLSCKTNLINDLGATWHSSATRERMPMCAATRRIGILWRRAAHVSCCANSRPPW